MKNTIEILRRVIANRHNMPTATNGRILDERSATANAILIETLWINLIHDAMKSKSIIKSQCISMGFIVRSPKNAIGLANKVYNALQSNGVKCYCRGTMITLDEDQIATAFITKNFISVQCGLREYNAAMEFLKTE
jgi:hypothetical protein